MYELHTPKEMISQMVKLIENERKKQKIQQKELSLKACIPLPTCQVSQRCSSVEKAIARKSLGEILNKPGSILNQLSKAS